jgi:hypothetical protein
MVSILTWPRVLLFAFLLLACSSAEASMGFPSSPNRNLSIISYEAKQLSVTNTPVNTLSPVCEVLKKKSVTRYSYKQWYYLNLAMDFLIASIWVFIALFITHIFSMGMAIILWILLFLGTIATIHEAGALGWITLLVSFCIIPTTNFPKVRKVVAGVGLVTLIVSFLAVTLIDRNQLTYVNDYSFPEYLVSSTSTNIVVIHEKIDLPYARSSKWLVYRDGRMTRMRTNELARLLQAQAGEISRFRQAEQPQKSE